jgi:mRNA-degrading endonuclease toxin of MazEF toxin-antitoxin module
MTVKRGEVWLANLNPTRGSEQAGIRPVILFQNYDKSSLEHPGTRRDGCDV